jgi:hypothetical protein
MIQPSPRLSTATLETIVGLLALKPGCRQMLSGELLFIALVFAFSPSGRN